MANLAAQGEQTTEQSEHGGGQAGWSGGVAGVSPEREQGATAASGPSGGALRPLLWPVLVGLVILLTDQVTKEWVLRSLVEEQEGASWFGGNLSIIHVNNDGAAFGLLAGQMFLFVLIGLVVAAVVVAYYRYLPRERLWLRVSLGLQMGGAVGNLLDRLRHGYVVDFVEVRNLPVFNVADTAIVCGVLILAYYLLVHLETPAQGKAAPGPRGPGVSGEPHGGPPQP